MMVAMKKLLQLEISLFSITESLISWPFGLLARGKNGKGVRACASGEGEL